MCMLCLRQFGVIWCVCPGMLCVKNEWDLIRINVSHMWRKVYFVPLHISVPSSICTFHQCIKLGLHIHIIYKDEVWPHAYIDSRKRKQAICVFVFVSCRPVFVSCTCKSCIFKTGLHKIFERTFGFWIIFEKILHHFASVWIIQSQ